MVLHFGWRFNLACETIKLSIIITHIPYHYPLLLKDNIEHDVHDILASNNNVTYVHNAD